VCSAHQCCNVEELSVRTVIEHCLNCAVCHKYRGFIYLANADYMVLVKFRNPTTKIPSMALAEILHTGECRGTSGLRLTLEGQPDSDGYRRIALLIVASARSANRAPSTVAPIEFSGPQLNHLASHFICTVLVPQDAPAVCSASTLNVLPLPPLRTLFRRAAPMSRTMCMNPQEPHHVCSGSC
jgi:hypothetical protein